jgi:two-component system chemotaxis response regulator CheB
MTTPVTKTRVLLVDDSAIVRKVVSEGLIASGTMDVVGTAPNGKVALEKLEFLAPDIVLLDLEMPVLGGIETLKALRKRFKSLPVVVFSTITERGAQATLDALSAGANDYMCKPSGPGNLQASVNMIRDVLAPKLRALALRAQLGRGASPAPAKVQAPPPPLSALPSSAPIDAIAIGCSVGGPQALDVLIPALPKDLGVPVFIVQHMPAIFTTALASRLAGSSQVRVVEATDGMAIAPGTVYLAAGEHHLLVTRSGPSLVLTLDRGPAENGCRPAVDPLFRSAAAIYGSRLLSLVLTGMGMDGTLGAADVRRAGGRVWAQDEASSAIWGMAGSVVRAGLAEKVCRLSSLASEIARATRGSQGAAARARS